MPIEVRSLDTKNNRIAVAFGTRTVRHLSPGEAFKLSRDLAGAAWSMLSVRLAAAAVSAKVKQRRKSR